MTKQDFKDLTGENPEDMFGGDYKNVFEEMEEAHAKDECSGCAMCDPEPMEKLNAYYKQQAEI